MKTSERCNSSNKIARFHSRVHLTEKTLAERCILRGRVLYRQWQATLENGPLATSEDSPPDRGCLSIHAVDLHVLWLGMSHDTQLSEKTSLTFNPPLGKLLPGILLHRWLTYRRQNRSVWSPYRQIHIRDFEIRLYSGHVSAVYHFYG